MLVLLSLFCLFSLSIAVPAFAFAPIAKAQPSTASRASAGSTLSYIRDLDSPAVARIVTEVDAQVICAGCSNNGSNYVFPSAQQVYPVEFAGSGAFISSDGYLLTAYHVVDLNCADNQGSVLQYWQSDVESNYQSYGFSDASAATQFVQNVYNNNLLSVQCQNTSFSEVFPSSAYTGSLSSAGALVGYKVTQIVQSSPVSQQDTAIIKVDAPHDMPYLTLAAQSDVQTGESITAIAFPGDADQASFGVLLNPTQANADVNTLDNLITPSIDSGQITTTQTLQDGTVTYETAGIAYHGSSGGPAVDDQGRIVGFFDYLTSGSASQSQRVSVMIASAVAATYAKQAGLATPRAGTVEPLWTKAMNDYYGSGPCHFGNAYSDLTQLRTLHPEFGGAQSFLVSAQQKQTPSACQASLQHGPSAFLIVVLLLIVLALIGAGVYFFVIRRRAPHAVLAPVSPGGATIDGAARWPGDMSQGGGYFGPAGALGAGQPTVPGAYDPTSAPPTPAPGAGQQSYAPGYMPNAAPGYTPAPNFPPATPAPQYPPTSSVPPATPAPATPATPAPAAPVPVAATPAAPMLAPGERMCLNGHIVNDPGAHFCAICGATVQSPPMSV